MILPNSYRYFHITPYPVHTTLTINADQFWNDAGEVIHHFKGIGTNGYAHLFINGMLQEERLYELTESSLTLYIDNSEIIHKGTPIIVETHVFVAQVIPAAN